MYGEGEMMKLILTTGSFFLLLLWGSHFLISDQETRAPESSPEVRNLQQLLSK